MDGRSGQTANNASSASSLVVPCLISTMLLCSSVVSVESPSLAWAAVYGVSRRPREKQYRPIDQDACNCEMRSSGNESSALITTYSALIDPPPTPKFLHCPPTLPLSIRRHRLIRSLPEIRGVVITIHVRTLCPWIHP